MIRPSRLCAVFVAGLFAGTAIWEGRAVAEDPPAQQAETPAPAATPAPAPAPAAEPAPAAAVAKPPEKADDIPRPNLKLCAGLAGGAGVLLITGIILGAIAKTRSDEQNGDVSNPPVYDSSLKSRGSQGEAMATAAYVMFGIGGAIAIADIVLWIERLRPRKTKETQALRSLPARATVTPTPMGLQVTF